MAFREWYQATGKSKIASSIYSADGDSESLSSNTKVNFTIFHDLQYLNLVWDAAAAAKLLQSCPTLCDPIDGSLPGSPIPGILQARTLEWVAISFSNAWK